MPVHAPSRLSACGIVPHGIMRYRSGSAISNTFQIFRPDPESRRAVRSSPLCAAHGAQFPPRLFFFVCFSRFSQATGGCVHLHVSSPPPSSWGQPSDSFTPLSMDPDFRALDPRTPTTHVGSLSSKKTLPCERRNRIPTRNFLSREKVEWHIKRVAGPILGPPSNVEVWSQSTRVGTMGCDRTHRGAPRRLGRGCSSLGQFHTSSA